MQGVEKLTVWWEMLGVVVHVDSKADRKQKEREGGRGRLGVLCSEGKRDSSPLIPEDGKLCSLSYSQERG